MATDSVFNFIVHYLDDERQIIPCPSQDFAERAAAELVVDSIIAGYQVSVEENIENAWIDVTVTGK